MDYNVDNSATEILGSAKYKGLDLMQDNQVYSLSNRRDQPVAHAPCV